MYKLVLVRHGQSEWNKKKLFTGWRDVPLSPQGIEEARTAGQLLKKAQLHFNYLFTSVLMRAQTTAELILEELQQTDIPRTESWRLNERHYGKLQGLNKEEMMEEHGEAQVHQWRRSFATPPPPLDQDDSTHPLHDPKYTDVDPSLLPSSESLKDTLHRVLPFWTDTLAPALTEHSLVLVVAHGNSLRALVKHLEKISDEKISELNIDTGVPLVYELNESLEVIKTEWLKPD